MFLELLQHLLWQGYILISQHEFLTSACYLYPKFKSWHPVPLTFSIQFQVLQVSKFVSCKLELLE